MLSDRIIGFVAVITALFGTNQNRIEMKLWIFSKRLRRLACQKDFLQL